MLLHPTLDLLNELGLTGMAVGRELKKLGYVKRTARPRHDGQNEFAMESFKKKTSLPSWQRSERPSSAARP